MQLSKPLVEANIQLDTKKKINENILLLVLAAINFTHIMDFVIIAPLNPFLKEVFQINTRQFGFLMSAYTLSAGIFGFLAFFFIDQFDRRKALIFLYCGFALSNFLCALANSFEFFMATRIFAGAFGGVLGALVLSVVGDAVPPERRGRATGVIMSAFSAASIVGIPIGLYFAEIFSWHAPFILITVLSVIVLFFAYKYLPSMTGHLSKKAPLSPFDMLTSILSIENVRWAMAFMFVLMVAGFTVVPFLSDYMVKNMGIAKNNLRYVYLFGGLATAVSGPIIGRLADKFGKRKMFVIAAILSIMPMFLVTNLGHVEPWIAFAASTLFFIFFGGRFVPAMALLSSSVEPQNRGKFMSINSCVQSLSSSVSSFGAGLIILNTAKGELTNYNIVGYIAIIATIGAIIISYRVKQIS